MGKKIVAVIDMETSLTASDLATEIASKLSGAGSVADITVFEQEAEETVLDLLDVAKDGMAKELGETNEPFLGYLSTDAYSEQTIDVAGLSEFLNEEILGQNYTGRVYSRYAFSEKHSQVAVVFSKVPVEEEEAVAYLNTQLEEAGYDPDSGVEEEN